MFCEINFVFLFLINFWKMKSPNLEKYFDSHINPNLDQELLKILRYINPEYIEAFQNFRLSVLWTLAEEKES